MCENKYFFEKFFLIVFLSPVNQIRIIMNLIDDVIISSKKRCLDPVGMERSVSFSSFFD